MEQPNSPNTTANPPWKEEYAVELWKYFSGVGAADKNTMVTVESLLLGFSAALIGYVTTYMLTFDPLSVIKSSGAKYVSILGIAISFVAGYVSLLYGGYSNWNWAQADDIARDLATRDPKWNEVLPENAEAAREKWKSLGRPSVPCAIALRWGKPCYPTRQLAPIFYLFLGAALVCAIFHLSILLLSV